MGTLITRGTEEKEAEMGTPVHPAGPCQRYEEEAGGTFRPGAGWAHHQ